MRIDPLSVTSLFLDVFANGHKISTATGFVVERTGKFFLITNWHVFSGRNSETTQLLSSTGAIPDEIRVAHHLAQSLGEWRFVSERLLSEDGAPAWIEHPLRGQVDVAAIELRNTSGLRFYPLDLRLEHVDLEVYPGMPVHVIGFPLGLRPSASFAIWKTGHIASDPDYPYLGLPAFLIDPTTRGGMSGSPVVARATGNHLTSLGMNISSLVKTRFLGVYSSRIHEYAEIGTVWWPSVVSEVLDRAPDARK